VSYALGLALSLIGIALPAVAGPRAWRDRAALRELLKQPPPQPSAARWWSDLVLKWWRRIWAFSAAILLAVVGVVMADDAANSTELTWVRSTLSLAALLLGYIAVGAVVEMNFLVRRVVRQPSWNRQPLDTIDQLVVALSSICCSLVGVSVLANAVA
jgi:hypothetical protein